MPGVYFEIDLRALRELVLGPLAAKYTLSVHSTGPTIQHSMQPRNVIFLVDEALGASEFKAEAGRKQLGLRTCKLDMACPKGFFPPKEGSHHVVVLCFFGWLSSFETAENFFVVVPCCGSFCNLQRIRG